MKITTVIADDHSLVRSGYKAILNSDPQIKHLAEAGDGVELLQLLEDLQPAVVLLDLMMPRMDGLEAARIIAKRYPRIRLLFLSMCDDTTFVREAWHLGARAYLLKEANAAEIIQAVKTIAGGGYYYTGKIAKRMDQLIRGETSRKDDTITFSATEVRILGLLCKGLPVKEISVVIVRAPKTVEHYIERMKERTGAKNIAELAVKAVIHGVVAHQDLL